ncbi:MAG: Small GTP-binding domain protein, Arf-domain signature [Promethearchaeota archaeon]|nr:MAG: Small GTP-binding domain protein, Arf-domain signature [Candidatus Lokiarchaeota archaeon]
MLRQIHVLYKGNILFTHSYAQALGREELDKAIDLIKSHIDMPMPGKTLQRPLSDFQLFHQGKGDKYFIIITDTVDSLNYIDKILSKIVKKFDELFPYPEKIEKKDPNYQDFLKFLSQMQKELHSKIAIVGPINAGKTKLYNMLKVDKERSIMNFAKASNYIINDVSFDLWDFQLKDNFSLLWSKFIKGADLVILIFDLSKYNVKIIQHFLDLKKREANLSKFLKLGNKKDLIDDSDLSKVKNELSMEDFQDISLNASDAKLKIDKLISETLKLKRKLPEKFDTLRKEAKNLEEQNQLAAAISKYKQLISICNEFQNFTYIDSFKEQVNKLNKQLEEEKEIRRKIERKKKFAPPEKIKFTKKVSVKPLPQSKGKKPNVKPLSDKDKSSIMEMEKEKTQKKKKQKKLRLAPKDVKIDLKIFSKEEQKKELKKEVEIKEAEYQDLKGLEDYAKALQMMIEERGSFLKLELCKQYVKDLSDSLGREVNFEDLKLASKFFVNQEQEGF